MLLMTLEAFAASLIAHRYLRLPFGVGLLSYVSATILILYVSDFAGLLQPTSWALHVLIAIGLGVLLVEQTRLKFSGLRSRGSVKSVIAVSAIAFCALQVALFCSAKEYSAWDEFSHWGTVIRVIFEANTFRLHPNPLYFQDYPPGLALFAYHAMQLAGYSEPNAYFAYAILLFCFSASILQLGYRASLGWFFVALVLVWGVVQFWGGGWASVLVDHMLSIYFAGIVGAYFLLRQSKVSILALALALGAFTLAKQAASSLALLAVGLVLADWLFDRVRYYRAAASRSMAGLASDAVTAAVLLGATILVPLSWQAYVAAAGVMQGWGSYSPYGGIGKLVTCCTTDREITVATKFFSDFVGSTVVPGNADTLLAIAWKGLAGLSWSDVVSGSLLRAPGMAMAGTALASLLLLAALRTNAERLRHLLFSMLLMAGAVGYVVSLLTAYLYSYSDYEAETLASFDRFLNVYTIGWMLAVFAAALRGWPHRRGDWRGYVVTAAAFLGLVAVFWPGVRTSLPIVSPSQLQAVGSVKIEGRARIQQWAAAERAKIPEGAKVYILWPGTSGLEFWLVKYELLPHLTNLDCFGVVPALPKELLQECVLPSAELTKTLAGYDYVLIGDGMPRLHEAYGEIFPAGPDDTFFLFRVETTDGLHLVPAQE